MGTELKFWDDHCGVCFSHSRTAVKCSGESFVGHLGSYLLLPSTNVRI